MQEKTSRNKMSFKLLFDIVMFLLLMLMYSKMSISMTFHEAGGLCLFGLFIIHLIYNHRWIAGVTKKLFSKSLSARTRLGYIVNLLLVIVFTLVGISGIAISKVLFPSDSSMSWKAVHYASASTALVLIGIHVGLHMKMIVSFIKKKVKIPALARKIIGIVLLLAVVLFGTYNIKTTSFTRWISMPFTASDMANSGAITGNGAGHGEQLMDGSGQGQGHGQGEGGFSLSNALLVVIRFASIAGVFTIATVGLEMLVDKRKVPMRVRSKCHLNE